MRASLRSEGRILTIRIAWKLSLYSYFTGIGRKPDVQARKNTSALRLDARPNHPSGTACEKEVNYHEAILPIDRSRPSGPARLWPVTGTRRRPGRGRRPAPGA